MYITVIGLAKISTLRTFHELTPQKPHRFLIRSTKILVSLCCVSSLVSLGVQCLPRPWDTTHGTCINRAALWIFVAIWDIFTDVAIVTMAFLILRTLDINRSSRRCCLLAFTIRLLYDALEMIICVSSANRPQMYTCRVGPRRLHRQIHASTTLHESRLHSRPCRSDTIPHLDPCDIDASHHRPGRSSERCISSGSHTTARSVRASLMATESQRSTKSLSFLFLETPGSKIASIDISSICCGKCIQCRSGPRRRAWSCAIGYRHGYGRTGFRVERDGRAWTFEDSIKES